MRFTLFFTYLVLALLLVTPVHAQNTLIVENVRFGVHQNSKNRMVIDLNQSSDFKSFILPAIEGKPHRLVVDLPDFDWQAGNIPRSAKIPVLDVRSGTLQAGIKRIVIDLNQPAKITGAFLLPRAAGKSDRLVIDFQALSASAFAQTERVSFGTLQVSDKPQDALGALINQQTNATAANFNLKPAPRLSRSGMVLPPRKPKIAAPIVTSPTPISPLRKPLIVIDAGHGGQDPGAVGAGKLLEKNITLSAAKILKSQLESTGRYQVALTRHNDTYLKLYKRVGIARDKEADLFISLHADSIDKPKVRGASIYTLSNKASDKQTARLAARENQVDLIAGVDLSHEDKDVANILIDLAMRDTMNQSKFFANNVVTHMQSNGVRTLVKPHRYAGFAVLKAPDIPSVLVEMGFMSNSGEAKLLATPNYQKKIAAALTHSIDAYFEKLRQNSVQ